MKMVNAIWRPYLIIYFLSGFFCVVNIGCEIAEDDRHRSSPDSDLNGTASTDAEAADHVATQSAPIINGTLETGYQNIGYLRMEREDGMYTCTGTAIAANWILTAAHCVGGLDPSAVTFHTGTDRNTDPGETYGALSIHIHPNYSQGAEKYDLALLLVDGLTSGPFYEYNISSVAIGTPVTWIGYGLNQKTPEETGGGTKRRGEGTITKVELRTITSGSAADVLPCNGDSGGPALATIEGSQRIVGVASEGNCVDDMVHVRVDGYARWIQLTMAGQTWTDCDVTGGECLEGACYPTVAGKYDCFPSDGLRPGDTCNPDVDTWMTGIPCEDGSACRPSKSDPGTGRCTVFCRNNNDCSASERCSIPVFTSIDSLGTCVTCTEVDSDGICADSEDTSEEPIDSPEESTDTPEESTDTPEESTDSSKEYIDPSDNQDNSTGCQFLTSGSHAGSTDIVRLIAALLSADL